MNSYQQIWQRGNSYYSGSISVNIPLVPSGIPLQSSKVFLSKSNIVNNLKSCEYFFRIMSESQNKALESRKVDKEIIINIDDSNKALEMKKSTQVEMTSASIQGDDEKALNHLDSKNQVMCFLGVLPTKHTDILSQITQVEAINILKKPANPSQHKDNHVWGGRTTKPKIKPQRGKNQKNASLLLVKGSWKIQKGGRLLP